MEGRWRGGRAFSHAGEEGEVGFQGRPGEGTAEADAERGGGGYDEGEAGEGEGGWHGGRGRRIGHYHLMSLGGKGIGRRRERRMGVPENSTIIAYDVLMSSSSFNPHVFFK